LHRRPTIGHAHDFLDRFHRQRKAQAADGKRDALAALRLAQKTHAPGVARHAGVGAHLGHVIDPHQRISVEQLQHARAIGQRDGAGNDAARSALLPVQAGALFGPHAQHFAGGVEHEAHLDVVDIDDHHALRARHAGCGRIENAAQVQQRDRRAAQREDAFEAAWRQRDRRDPRRHAHYFAHVQRRECKLLAGQEKRPYHFHAGCFAQHARGTGHLLFDGRHGRVNIRHRCSLHIHAASASCSRAMRTTLNVC
jgi:hypothetical protein